MSSPARTALLTTTFMSMVGAAGAIVVWMYLPFSDEGGSGSTTTVTATIYRPPVPIHCDPEIFQEMGYTLLFCDSGWASGGKPDSEELQNFQWVDGQWLEISPNGHTSNGSHCYDTSALRLFGAPEELLHNLIDCQV